MSPSQEPSRSRPSVLLIVAILGMLAVGATGVIALREDRPPAEADAVSATAEKMPSTQSGSPTVGTTSSADGVSHRSDGVSDSSPTDATVAGLPDDARLRELIVGTWEDDYQGHRTMTLHPDGSARMIVELTGLKATLFAERLEFDMQWLLSDGMLAKRTTGGRPEAKVKLILSTMGDRVAERIVEISEDRLLLQDQNGEQRYDWRRVSPESPAGK